MCPGQPADIEPAAWTVVPTGARAGHHHRTKRAGRQSDGAAAATVHRTAVLDGKRARAQAVDHDGEISARAGVMGGEVVIELQGSSKAALCFGKIISE